MCTTKVFSLSICQNSLDVSVVFSISVHIKRDTRRLFYLYIYYRIVNLFKF